RAHRALAGSRPLTIGTSARGRVQNLVALPIRSRRRPLGLAIGLLVLQTGPDATLQEAQWAARVLGERLAQLLEQRELSGSLERASQLKSQFLANMSHEFRTPLNAILGYAHLLLNGVSGELNPRQLRSLSRIDTNGRHLLALLNDILDISRIEAGKLPQHVSRFGLTELLQEVVDENAPAHEAGSEVRVSFQLPQRALVLESDRQKVKQILRHLLSNALKFTPRGTVTISVRRVPRERQTEISVTDTGIGIPAGELEKIFEDFRQLDDSPTRAYGGTGLGLSICRRLATMLGGRITVKSRPGKGSTFTLHLPNGPRRR
ncbi:MAG: sensor histidine kinase, partial [Myxococcales bacterium]